MPEVSSDEPQAENLIFPSKLRKPQAHSHSCRACLLNCVLFNFLCYSPKFPHRGLQKSFSVFPQGGGEAVFPFFSPLPFWRGTTRGVHKRETNGSVSAAISWIAQWERGKSGCMQRIGVALKQQPCCEGDGFSLRQSDCEPRVCKWNGGEEGCSLYRFKASVALPGMSAAAVRQRGKKKQWINRQRAADNSAGNTVTLFPAVCEFIRPHAVCH